MVCKTEQTKNSICRSDRDRGNYCRKTGKHQNICDKYWSMKGEVRIGKCRKKVLVQKIGLEKLMRRNATNCPNDPGPEF